MGTIIAFGVDTNVVFFVDYVSLDAPVTRTGKRNYLGVHYPDMDNLVSFIQHHSPIDIISIVSIYDIVNVVSICIHDFIKPDHHV